MRREGEWCVRGKVWESVCGVCVKDVFVDTCHGIY